MTEGRSEVIPVKVTNTGVATGEFDVIRLAVKAYQLASANQRRCPGRSQVLCQDLSERLPIVSSPSRSQALSVTFGKACMVEDDLAP